MRNLQDMINFITFRGVESKITMMRDFAKCLLDIVLWGFFNWLKVGATILYYAANKPFSIANSINIHITVDCMFKCVGYGFGVIGAALVLQMNPFQMAANSMPDGQMKDAVFELRYLWWSYAWQKITWLIPYLFQNIFTGFVTILKMIFNNNYF